MKQRTIYEIVNWWESKRKYYNLFFIVSYWMNFKTREKILVSHGEIEVYINVIVLGIILIGLSNLTYFLCSGIELTLKRYNGDIGTMNWFFLFVFYLSTLILFFGIQMGL